MYTGPPVPVLGSVALTAEAEGFLEWNQGAIGKLQVIAIVSRVTVQTPAMFLIVAQDDFLVHVFELTPLRISRHVLVVALGAGKEVRILEGRRRRLEDHRIDRDGTPDSSRLLI
jgi:hypothetical protein